MTTIPAGAHRTVANRCGGEISNDFPVARPLASCTGTQPSGNSWISTFLSLIGVANASALTDESWHLPLPGVAAM